MRYLLELNEVNDKVIRLTMGAEKFDKMLSIGKPQGDNSCLGDVENDSSSIPTKTKFMRESRPISHKIKPCPKTRSVPTCCHCGEVGIFIQNVENCTLERPIY